LAQGEYISPERLENIYLSHPGIAAVFVHGDSMQTCLVAIIGVDPEPFAGWASKVLRRSIPVAEISTVFKDPSIIKAMLKDLNRIGEKRKLNSFERIRGIHLAIEPFTIDNDLLTPTMKLKRVEAAKAFRSEIDALYNDINQKKVLVESKL
jgi:long-chain acyl-CoA synthetase